MKILGKMFCASAIFLGLSPLNAMDTKPVSYLTILAHRKTICKSILDSPAWAGLFEHDLDQLVSFIQHLTTTSDGRSLISSRDGLDTFITEHFCTYFKILKGVVNLPNARELHRRLRAIPFLSSDPQNFNEVTEYLIQWLDSKEIYLASVVIALEIFVGLLTREGQDFGNVKTINMIDSRMEMLLGLILYEQPIIANAAVQSAASRAYDAYTEVFSATLKRIKKDQL
jgi:hypothetical protein